MTPKKDTQDYLNNYKTIYRITTYILNSFEIEKCFKKDKKTIQKITGAIKQFTFRPGRRYVRTYKMMYRLVLYV